MLANVNDASLKEELHDIQSRLPVIYRYIVARSLTTSDSAACRSIGYSYQWMQQQDNHTYYNNLAERLACDRLLQAGLHLQELLPNAITKLGELLDSENERIRLQASIAILDRVGLERAIVSQSPAGSMRNLADVILNVYGVGAGAPANSDIVDGQIVDSDDRG